MTDEVEIKRLTKIFKKLGARDPQQWAESQVKEGMPQLARFLFLRQAWRNIVSEDDPSWIVQQIMTAQAMPDAPYAGIGLALESLRARGATDEELTELVRGTQAELLFQLCYLLQDHGAEEPEVSDIGWVLVQVDKEGNPVEAISGLHESVLETDPTGREVRPRAPTRPTEA